jgi:hypothetical protein
MDYDQDLIAAIVIYLENAKDPLVLTYTCVSQFLKGELNG